MNGNSADDLFQRLDQLNEIGAALSRERDIDRLLEDILLAAKDITRADGGTLYLMNEAHTHLRFEIMRTDSLGIALGGTTGKPVTLPELPLTDAHGAPNNALVAAYAAINEATVNIADAYTEAGFDFSGTRSFDARTGYRSRSFLTVPMKNHDDEIIGVLQLINAIDPASGAVERFSREDQRLVESLASQAAIALTNRQLIDQLERLFESFIGVLNLAIDEKSPYTGGHCQRVPELTLMLADAVNRCDEGVFADFHMDEKARYELKIAGLLHDCGKVTTPVHVVDKSSKLETIFDRIHLVDARFEVLKRDAEIRVWRKAAGGELPPALAAELADECAALDAERDFLRHANVGNEAMRPEDQDRVREIAGRHRWRKGGEEEDLLSANEVENLCVRAGTLTAAEREIINHHIVATIRMLEQLPWPRHLRRVTEYAGGHHERMDGKGYPKGLKGGDMSVPTRIMGIADIFEALTASDRPYKQGMKLSQAVSIMAGFARNGHIDPDLFAVFMRGGVFLDYARRFLKPEQIDAVDVTTVLATLLAGAAA